MEHFAGKKALGQHRTIPALRLKHRSGGSPRQEPPQAAVALRSASLRLGVRHSICVAKMLDNVGLRYPHRASGAKAPRTLRPLPLLRFAVSATGGAHLCSIQYYLRFWLSSCRTSLAVSALRIMRYCLKSEWRKSKFAVGDLFHQLLDGFQAGSLSTGAHYAGGTGGSGKAQRFFQRQAALFGNS